MDIKLKFEIIYILLILYMFLNKNWIMYVMYLLLIKCNYITVY